MKNISMQVESDVLTIRINLKEEHGESSSGKSITIASTMGNKPIEGYPGILLGLNCYRKK